MGKMITDSMTWSQRTTPWEKVKDELQLYIEADPRPKLEIIQDAGLSKDAYYKLFKGDRKKSPMRRGTVEGLAKALNLTCIYPESGIPIFSPKNVLAQSLKTSNIKEVIEYAVKMAGSVQQLSEKSDTPIDEIKKYLNPIGAQAAISIEKLNRFAQAIGRSLIVFGENSLSFVSDPGVDTSRAPSLIRVDLANLASTEGMYTPRIFDEGLSELLNPEGKEKHCITDQEIELLCRIQDNQKTTGSTIQWTNILYAIRGLGPIQ